MAETPLNRARVAEWLESHPDFFRDQPELLDCLNLPHGCGASSLIEHQVHRLQDENRRLKGQLEQLSGIAGENERLMQRLHALTLELMDCTDVPAFVDLLCRRLAEDFQADVTRLNLLKPGPDLAGLEPVRALPDNPPPWLNRLMEGGRAECGRLTRAKLECIFGADSAITSAALVPVDGIGVLAIGSTTPERFNPDMGTLFLELLAKTVHFRLESTERRQRKRA